MRVPSFTSARGRLGGLAVPIGVSVAALALLALLQGPEAARAQFSNQGMPTPDATPAPGTSATRPRFSVDATLQPGDSAAEVRIDYRMGRDELLFERAEDGYRAAYEIRVIFYKSKGGAQVTGDAFERNLHVRNYADTRLRGADVIDHVALRVPPGKYRVQVVITDLVAERASGTEIPFEVLAAGKNLVWFSDLSLGTVADSAASGAGSGTREHFVPVPARRFGLDLPTLAVIGEVVDGRPAPPDGTIEHYKVAVRVLNDLQEEVWKADTLLARTGARTPFMIRPRLGAIAAGSYRVALDLLSPSITPPGKKKPVPVHRERNFDVDQTSENVAWESRASLEVLRYVATNEEKDEMDRLSSPDARKTFWESFWKRRDPTSETERNEALEEFYRRVQYSNQHFSVGIAGWRTDMGRLYIKLGAPDEIVRNPFNFDRPPEEIWFYYPTQRRFVFVDRDGFGRFELDGKQSSAED